MTLNNLPNRWAIAQLGEIATYINGRAFKPSEWKEKGKPIIRIQNLNSTGAKFNYSDQDHEEKYKVRNGDLLIAWSASLGAFFWKGGDAWLNQHIFNAKHNNNVVTKSYLYFVLVHAIRDLYNKTHGTGMVHVTKPIFESHQIPLAPYQEQQRIVAKLEKLMSKVDQCKARLEKIPSILKRFRQSVLASACSGELTKNWRKNNSNVESAESLLNRVVEERNGKYEKACITAKIKGKKKPRSFTVSDEPLDKTTLAEIPEDWAWESLVNLANIRGGVTKGRKFKDRKTVRLKYLRVANVQDGFFDLSQIKEIKALPEDLEKYRLKDGDILFTEGGDRDKLGRGTVWKNNIEDCIHQNHIFRARLYSSRLVPEYISIATKSSKARDYFFEHASQTVNLASINMTTLGKVPIALPPQNEQKEIVHRVQSLFITAAQIEARYNKAKEYVDKLTQSILAKAFRGELVPQDSNAEPASKLLERIREEREKRRAEGKPKRRLKKRTRSQKQKNNKVP